MSPPRPLPSALLLLSAVLAACVDPPPESTVPLEVEYAGCQAVLIPGPVCVLGSKGLLWLWVRDRPEARIEIRAGGERIDAVGQPVREGQQFSFKVPPGAERLDVLVEARDGYATWSLALGTEVQQRRQGGSQDVIGEVDQTTRLLYGRIEDRQFTEAREELNRLLLLLPTKTPGESRYLIAYYRGVLAEKEGDYRSALTETHKALEIAERVLRDERLLWLAQQQLGLLLLAVGRYREAAETFERLGRAPKFRDSYEEGQLLNNQAWSALLAREAGEDFPDPTPLFEKALEKYKNDTRFTPDKELNVLINLALAHLQEGRLPKAREWLGQARGLEQHASLFYRLWWLDLEARIALREQRPDEALRLFERHESLALAASSPDGWRAAFGQAQALEDLGHRNAALEALEKVEALLDEQSLQVPLHEGRETFMAMRQAVVSLHVDLLLKQRRTADALLVARQARSRMLRQLERSDRLADLASAQRVEWDRLLTEYQEKRTALDKQAKDDWTLPTDRLRRERAARASQAEELKQLLDQAFLLLRVPGAQRDEMPPLRAGELLLAYHPLPGGDWVGFAASPKTIQFHVFKLPPEVLSQSQTEELSLRLLLPFSPAIERAKRIRILPSGPLQDVDFHALPFAGDVLLAGRPVVYGLDLPAPLAPSDTPGRRALLVTDPQSNLLGAREEAQTVRKTLESRAKPWTVETLTAAVASAEAVRGRLATVDLLHYAGHGVFSGFGGWDSSLLLAEETRLTLGDLLALGRVPAWVVLSACDGGRSSAEASVEGLGLAQAFLLAGSRAVIASTRPADDLTVPELFAELYRQWDQDPAMALQRAQLAWRQRNPQADWAAFRLFEP